MDFQFHLRKLLQHEEDGSAKASLKSALQICMILSACSVVMFLCTVFIILRIYHSRRRQNNHNIRNTSILFNDIDVHGDSSSHSPNSNDDVVEHTIWHIRTAGLQQSVIDSITVFKYYKKDEGVSVIDGTKCSVCLGELQHEESLKLLPKCSHAFHISCIDTWLTSHKNCPLCRAPIVNDQQRDSGEPVNQENHQIIDNFDHRVAVEGSYNDADNDAATADDSGISVGEVSDKILTVRRSVSVDLASSASVMIFRDKEDVVVEKSLGSEIHFCEKSNSMRRSFSLEPKFNSSIVKPFVSL